jgi:uncharacterized protein (TIGR02147 family)
MNDLNGQLALQKILQKRLASLKARNPAYSIRAFSKQVGVTPGTLSLILLGKRKASKKLALKIADKLALDPCERSELLECFPKPRRQASTEEGPTLSYLQLTADQFRVVAEWHYFAILNLIELKNFKSGIASIANRLGVSETKTKDAIERLKRLGMLAEDELGNFSRTQARYRTTDDIADISLQKSHHETLELAKESIIRDSVDRRDFTWVTFAMDKKKLPQAKTLIRKFQDDLIDLLDQNSEPDEVYRLSMQLFPLTQVKG